ncbi:MAG: DUF934 domain-containing protein [Steroidobacteraceae bacterium]
MRRILRRREIVVDDWRHRGEEPMDTPDADPAAEALIVPLAEFRANPASWRTRQGRLGVRLSPADSTEELSEELPRLSLIAIEFPGPGDGRGFTQARLLRTRLHFEGELRAVGAGVKQDLVFLMARCGFDSFELAPGQTFEDALKAFSRYTVAYQPGAPLESIRQQRFFAAS